MRTVKRIPVNHLVNMISGKNQKIVVQFLIDHPDEMFSCIFLKNHLDQAAAGMYKIADALMLRGILNREKNQLGVWVYDLNLDKED